MDSLREFSIAFEGLKDGLHQFQFDVVKQFFSSFENSLISDGKLDVKLDMDKRPDLIILDFHLKGFIWDQCDRCLSNIPIPLEANSELLIKYADEPKEEEEIIYLTGKESNLNLAKYIYEIIHLNIPIRKLRDCEEEGYSYCDKDVLKKLEENEVPENENNIIGDLLKNIDLKD
jgi:uncharacterized metal-binding protein YceD (DUF177 family)